MTTALDKLRKLAASLGLGRLKDRGKMTFSGEGVHAHVWFDAGVAQDDFGRHVRDSGEYQVIISTSPDPLNMKPRGKELARETFRYADPKMAGLVQGSAEDYIKKAMFKHRGRRAGDEQMSIEKLRELHTACCGGCNSAGHGTEDEQMAGRKWDGDKTSPDRSPYWPGKRKEINSPPLAGQPGSAERKKYNQWWRSNFWNAKAADGLDALPLLDDDSVDDILAEVLFDGEMAGRKWDGDKTKADRHPYHPGKRKEIGQPPLAGPDGSPQRKQYNNWWRENFWNAKAADCMGALACMDEPVIDEVMDDEMLDDVFSGRKWDGDRTKADRHPYFPGKRKEIGDPPLAGQPGSAERKKYNQWWRANFWNAKSAWDRDAALDDLRSLRHANSPVAKTILAQMGGARRLMAMLGVKQFVTSSNSVSFKSPNKQRSKGNSVKISLRGDDTYDVEFFNVAKFTAKSVKKHSGVYAEDLVNIFERQTGWYLRLGRKMFSAEGFRRVFAEDSHMGMYGEEIFAEGCPDNLDEKECEEWEKNTLFHKDQFKAGAGILGPAKEAKAGDQREQDKMWAKGYRYMIQWSSNSKLKNKDPLYVKSPSAAAKLVREDYPDEKNWKATPLTDPKTGKKADWETGEQSKPKKSGPGVGKGEGSDVPDGDGNRTKRAAKLKCDGKKGCTDDVAYIDTKGFIYCPNHAPARNDRNRRARKLRPAEIKKLEAGQTIKYGSAFPMRTRTQPRIAATLYVAISGGKLLGATDGKHGAEKEGWRNVERVKKVNSFEIVEAKNVPTNVAENMVDWGSNNPKTNYWKDEKTAYNAVSRYLPKGKTAASKLTSEQIKEVQGEMVPKGVPVRFMSGGSSLNIVTGEKTTKGANVMHQIVYWNFSKETSKKIAKWLGVRASFDKSAATEGVGDELGGKTAASGNYGFTKAMQRDIDVAARRIAKAATSIAKKAHGKDARVADFLVAHAKRGKSLSAKVLVAALQEMAPKLATEDGAKAARLQELREANGGLKLAVQKGKIDIKITVKKKGDDFVAVMTTNKGQRRVQMVSAEGFPLGATTGPGGDLYQVCRYEIKALIAKESKTAKEAKYGLYGYRSKTSKLGLGACSDLRHESGRIGSDLHRRRHDKHAKISEYLKAHCKEADCNYSRLLMAGYPGADMKFAALPVPESIDDWIAWEE